MIISTRGRYALRVMIDLAENSGGELIPMKTVAERQNISLKYLEKILPALKNAGLIEGVHGKGGGYRLTRAPEDYRVYDILVLTEGELATVACLDCKSQEKCSNSENCRTKPMWTELQKIIGDYLKSVTIKDLMKKDNGAAIGL